LAEYQVDIFVSWRWQPNKFKGFQGKRKGGRLKCRW
jgi:hypothetical protein